MFGVKDLVNHVEALTLFPRAGSGKLIEVSQKGKNMMRFTFFFGTGP